MDFIEELSATWRSGQEGGRMSRQGGTEWEGRMFGSVRRSVHK